MDHSYFYLIGFVIAVCYLAFSFDDLIWDIAHFIHQRKHKDQDKLHIEKLDSKPPRLLAVMVAAWHEDSVLEPVIDNMISSVQYPRSMYHVFLGVYPNDEATMGAAKRLEDQYDNVHMVINDRPGPTCKADNINNMLRYIRAFEQTRGWRFASVTVHDSEDIVHPYELKVTNYLNDQFDALQFPVFPLQRMPSIKNIFSSMTSGTYADEFAENHFRAIGMRDKMSAVVPSAGTGFVISRRVLDVYKDEPLFPEDSLTEDYKLSLTLAQQGYKVHYVLEKVQRLSDHDKIKWEYIATRSIFPATYKTAVRQKTRWIYGITMQSVKFTDIFKAKHINIAGRYTLYKDLKTKVGNLVIIPGYFVFIYSVVSWFLQLPVIYPMYSVSWWLCIALTVMMVYRQTLRAVAIKNIYGFKSVIISCLLPPLIPIRLVWGNIINASATLCAWKQLFFGAAKGQKGQGKRKVAWNKTDHEFIDKHILYRYYRNLGDVLLEKEYIVGSVLKTMLQISRQTSTRLGDVLMNHNIIMEEQLIEAVALCQHRVFVRTLSPFGTNHLRYFDKMQLWKTYSCPIIKINEGYIYAVTNDTTDAICEEYLRRGDKLVYTTKYEVILYLSRIGRCADEALYVMIKRMLREGQLNWEQAVIALNYANNTEDIIEYMGLGSCGRLCHNNISEFPLAANYE